MSNLVNSTIKQYKILQLINEGGMGSIYKAQDTILKRTVAIKVMLPRLARRPNFRQAFLEEAQAAASLDHPGIVKVHEFDEAEGMLFIVMEYISGPDLRKMLDTLQAKGQWLPLNEAIGMVRQIALALDYAHQQGVLHRDIKPSNIMIKLQGEDGLAYRPVITDLGLAKLLSGLQVSHKGEASMGTPAYMSPEQAQGKPLDGRSDVYSLGVLLYELSVGRPPFQARTIAEAVRDHTQVMPPAPSAILPDYPPELESIVLKALCKDPDERYQSAAELAEALEKVRASLPRELASTTLLQKTASASLTSFFPKKQPLPARPASRAVDLGPREIVLEIHTINQKDRTIPLKLGRNMIGREAGCEILLEDVSISRQHAYIEYDGKTCQLVDNKSSNGTFLSGVRLPPGVPSDWRVEQPIRIGRFWLRLKIATRPTSGTSQPEGQQAAGLGALASKSGKIAMSVNPPQLSVEPGGSAEVAVDLINQDQVKHRLKVSVEGLSGKWINNPSSTMELQPGETQTARITIQPPRVPESRAGRHPFSVRVASLSQPGELVTQKVTLTLGHYVQFSSRLEPQKVRAGEVAQILVENQGNLPESFKLKFEDRRDELQFNSDQTQVQIPAGQAGVAQFRAQTQKKRWVGGEKTHAFSAQVGSSKGEIQTVSGDMVSRGLIPVWLFSVLVILFVALLAAAAIYLPDLFPSRKLEVAQGTPTTPTPTLRPDEPVIEWCIYPSSQPPAQLTACPVQFFVAKGQKVTIAWKVRNTDGVQISPLGDRANQGQEEYLPFDSTAFTLRAFYAGKPELIKETTIQVIVVAPGETPSLLTIWTPVPSSTALPTQTTTPGGTPQTPTVTASAPGPTPSQTNTSTSIINTETTITSHEPNPSLVNQPYTVKVTVSSNSGTPGGTVTVNDGTGASCTTPSLSNGSGQCTLTSTTSGNKTLTASYTPGSSTFAPSSGTTAHTVQDPKKIATDLKISSDNPDPSKVNEPYTVKVTISPASGTDGEKVSITDGSGARCDAPLSGGAGQCNLISTSFGNPKILTASYPGNSTYNPSIATENHTVDRIPPTITIDSVTPEPSSVDQPYNVSVTVGSTGGTPGGTVTITNDENRSCTATLTGGSGYCALTSSTPGQRQLTANYNGDSTFEPKGTTASHKVLFPTYITINSVTPEPSFVTQDYTVRVTVNVTGTASSGTPDGKVSIDDGTHKAPGICDAILSGGTGECTLKSTTPDDKKILTLNYIPGVNSDFALSVKTKEHQVIKIPTTITITNVTPEPSYVNEAYTVKVSVSAVWGPDPSKGKVTISSIPETTTVQCETDTLSSGSGSCSLTSTSSGVKTLTAYYPENDTFTSYAITKDHTVNKIPTTITIDNVNPNQSYVNEPYTVKVSVNAGGGQPDPSGPPVSISDGSVSCNATLSGGTGSCSLASTTSGTKNLTANYLGNDAYLPDSDTESHMVEKIPTTVKITSHDPNPSTVGQTYTVMVTVNAGGGQPDPSGPPVSISDGSVSCNATLSGGTGSCSLASTTSGTKNLTANYLGNDAYLPDSDTKTHTVDPSPAAAFSTILRKFLSLSMGDASLLMWFRWLPALFFLTVHLPRRTSC